MKKASQKLALVSLLCMAFSTISFSQIPGKQVPGSHNLEVSFDPGAIFNASSSSSVFGLYDGLGIKYRKFTSESRAYRGIVNISHFSSTTITQQEDENLGLKELKDRSNQTGVYIRPGIEKHLGGTARLSPYFGGEVIFGIRQSNMRSEVQDLNSIKEMKTKNGMSNDGITLGLGGVAGLDFYIVPNLYLGIELGYALTYFSQATTVYTNINGDETNVNNGSALLFAPETFAVFRLGYLFMCN